MELWHKSRVNMVIETFNGKHGKIGLAVTLNLDLQLRIDSKELWLWFLAKLCIRIWIWEVVIDSEDLCSRLGLFCGVLLG